MIRLFDLIMIGVDISLIVYFYNVAVNTTEMSTRLISCIAMTMEVYFIRRHLKTMKLNAKKNNK